MVPSGTSLLWLTNHMADAERTWLLHRFRGADPAADPPHATTITQACNRYQEIWSASDEVIRATPDLGSTTPAFDDGPTVSLRWILLHLLASDRRGRLPPHDDLGVGVGK